MPSASFSDHKQLKKKNRRERQHGQKIKTSKTSKNILRTYLLVRIGSIERRLRSSLSRSRVLHRAMVDAVVRMERPQCSRDFFASLGFMPWAAKRRGWGGREGGDEMRRNETKWVVVVVVVVVPHIQRIGCQPEKTTLHGGQSRSWSAKQGKKEWVCNRVTV